MMVAWSIFYTQSTLALAEDYKFVPAEIWECE